MRTSTIRLIAVAAGIACGATFLAAAPQPRPFNHPLVFEPNAGQTASQVKWLARGPGYQLFLTADAATFVLRERRAQAPVNNLLPISLSPRPRFTSPPESHFTVVRMKLNGSRAWNAIDAFEPTGGFSNYFLGNDPRQWHTDIPQYARLKAASVYEGIDLVLYSHGGDLEYDFVVAPGADPKQIRLAFEGVERLRVDPKTDDLLLATTSGGELRQLRPKVYQQVGNRRVDVSGGYEILDRRQATFTLAAYDRRRPLVIDPAIIYTTFLGGSLADDVFGVAVDRGGNAYATGETESPDFFPVVGGIQAQFAGGRADAFVTKLDPTGRILFSTFLGGESDDAGLGIAVGFDGVYVTGGTNSQQFPTRNPIFPNRGVDAFVTKLSLAGNALIYSTYLGGSGFDSGRAIALDSSGAAYVGGGTASTDFPLQNPLQNSFGGGFSEDFFGDGFVAKLTPAGTSLAFSTFLGGAGADVVRGIAVDGQGFIYVTGGTQSPDFPIHNSNSTFQARQDVFVAKLGPNGQFYQYSILLGGSSGVHGDIGTGIAADAAGNAYITGTTQSMNFPTTVGAFQAVKISPGVAFSAFATKLDNFGSLVYSTYLSGSDGGTEALGIAINNAGNAYVVGDTSSTTFPGAPPITPVPTAGFLVKLTSDGSSLNYTVFLGAVINGVAVLHPPSPFLAVVPFAKIYTGGLRFTPVVCPPGVVECLGNPDGFVVALEEKQVLLP